MPVIQETAAALPRAGKKNIVKFAPKGTPSFQDTIKQRVDAYFKQKEVSTHANTKMRIKTIAMVSMYFVPYLFIVTGLVSSSLLLFYASWLVMGMGLVGIGTSVMHDSNHGAYSENKHVNKMLGGLLNVLGGYAPNWRIQHNILHHTYTNLDGLDEDIDGTKMLRMSPHKPLLKMHRFQHIYCWFLYCIMNLYWVTAKDYKLLFRYEGSGLLVKEKLTLKKALTELSLLKVFYFGYILVLPIMFAHVPWYHVVFGFLMLQVIAGFALAVIFQPAHVMEASEFPTPGADRKMENSWAVHQLLNTVDFAPNNKLLSWFIGGLNFQIEHHLFPHVCHVHYPALAKIVRYTAEEFGLSYQVIPSFRQAVYKHGEMLKLLGQR
ncbi:fatty acid desaturase family protein [Chitinophagaceae bacterium MMS25-I14]